MHWKLGGLTPNLFHLEERLVSCQVELWDIVCFCGLLQFSPVFELGASSVWDGSAMLLGIRDTSCSCNAGQDTFGLGVASPC